MALPITKAKTSVANVNAEIQKELEELKNKLSAPSGDVIRITQDKKFKLPNGETATSIQCVIVDFVNSNFYYDKPYVRGEESSPVCFSINENVADMVPSENSPEKQRDKCSLCLKNVFGSAGKGKACTNNKMLAILPPDFDDTTPLMLLKVMPTAIRPFDNYVNSIARSFQKPVRAVVTEITFNDSVDYPMLSFAALEPCDDETFMAAHARKAEAMERLLVEPSIDEQPQPVAKKAGLRTPRRKTA